MVTAALVIPLKSTKRALQQEEVLQARVEAETNITIISNKYLMPTN